MGLKLPPLRFVRSVMKDFMKTSGLEPSFLGPNLRITKVSQGTVDFELDIEQRHTNRLATLHGGTIASMVDLGGSLAVASRGLHSTGVTTDLNVTYVKSGGTIGDKIHATAVCEKLGKTLAFTSVTFRDGKGELTARGSHTKFVQKATRPASELYVLPEGSEMDHDAD